MINGTQAQPILFCNYDGGGFYWIDRTAWPSGTQYGSPGTSCLESSFGTCLLPSSLTSCQSSIASSGSNSFLVFAGSMCSSCALGYVLVGGSCVVNPCNSSPCLVGGQCFGTSGSAVCTTTPSCIAYRGSTTLNSTGWIFQTKKAITVSGVGAFDNGAGLTSSKTITILNYTVPATVVLSHTVLKTSLPVQSSFRWVTFPPVPLASGAKYAVLSSSFAQDTPASGNNLPADCVMTGGLMTYFGAVPTGANVLYTSAFLFSAQ